MKTTVVAVSTSKGGTAKTTTAVNLAFGLARLERERGSGADVVLVDLDRQGDSAKYLGLRKEWVYNPDTRPDGFCVSDVLLGRASVLDYLIEVEKNLSLVPASYKLELALDTLVLLDSQLKASAERGLPATKFDVPLRDVLSIRLKPLIGNARFIVLDCPPTLGPLALPVSRFADFVIAPVMLKYLPVAGVGDYVNDLERMRRVGGKAEILHVVPCMTSNFRGNEPHEIEERENLRTLLDVFRKSVFLPAVPDSVAVSGAARNHISIYDYAPGSAAAVAYQKLSERVYSRG